MDAIQLRAASVGVRALLRHLIAAPGGRGVAARLARAASWTVHPAPSRPLRPRVGVMISAEASGQSLLCRSATTRHRLCRSCPCPASRPRRASFTRCKSGNCNQQAEIHLDAPRTCGGWPDSRNRALFARCGRHDPRDRRFGGGHRCENRDAPHQNRRREPRRSLERALLPRQRFRSAEVKGVYRRNPTRQMRGVMFGSIPQQRNFREISRLTCHSVIA